MMAYDSLYNHEEAEINEREIVDRMKNNIITLRLNDKFDFDDSRSYLEWR